ncbi:MAG TPA: sulfotransferase [Bacteroidia bacterium]|jgi:hypothetical protein
MPREMSAPNSSAHPLNIAFIVGMGRSGTTMLTNMLNSNPETIACPENEFILHSFSSFVSADFNDPAVVDRFAKIFDRDFNRVISIWKPGAEFRGDLLRMKNKSYADACKLAYLNYPISQKDKKTVKLVVDKNPSYSLHIETLHGIFPGAKFIVITRDHRDNIISRKKYSDLNTPLYKLAADWNYYYEQIFKSLAAGGINYHLIRYEDLASQPETALRSLCQYLDIPYAEKMLHFQELSKKQKEHALENISEEKSRKIQRMHANLEKPVNTERTNVYLKELTHEEIALLDHACGKMAARFNYPVHDPSARVPLSLQARYRFAYLKTSVYGIINKAMYKLPISFRSAFRKQP